MAAIQGKFHTGAVALTGGTALTLLQIVAPTNQRLKLLAYSLSFDGTNSANTPANVQILRQTGGTFTNTTVAPLKTNDPSGTGETLQANGQTVTTVEPTAGDILYDGFEPVFGGLVYLPQTPGQELLIPGGTKLGFKVNAPQNVNARLTVYYEE